MSLILISDMRCAKNLPGAKNPLPVNSANRLVGKRIQLGQVLGGEPNACRLHVLFQVAALGAEILEIFTIGEKKRERRERTPVSGDRTNYQNTVAHQPRKIGWENFFEGRPSSIRWNARAIGGRSSYLFSARFLYLRFRRGCRFKITHKCTILISLISVPTLFKQVASI